MLLSAFNLNLLRSLDVLIETRNLTTAAKVLGLTQSTLSRQLVQLREQTGDPLLIREGQRFLLTQKAEALRGPLKNILANMETLLDTPHFDPAQCARQFSICGSDYIADHMLPELVRNLASQAPQLRIVLRMWEPGHYRLLADEGVDLVPTIADMIPDNLYGRSLGEDKAVCVMRTNHPLAKNSKLSLQDYVDSPHISIAGGSDKNSLVDQALGRQGLKRDIRLNVPFYAAALKLLIDNDLLLTIPVHIAIALARNSAIVWQPLPFDVAPYRYWLLWHARNHHDPAHQWFRNQVVEVLNHSMYGVTKFNAISDDLIQPPR
ncbi:LysR family transcriptional regulator [Solimicrobium silvestre]|uniref:LysR family transcriptional regulator n=1 Tax=Solimicrobium silvestre TaxID=2099400 RepID=UPI000CFB2FA0|nr:LysR family transcriptional regulator [Solimicrobium silvestre]